VPHIVEQRLTPTVYTSVYVDALAAASTGGLPVHLKVDTGMQRVGAHPGDAIALAEAIARHGDRLRLEGVLTHLAVADDPADEFTDEQLRLFDDVVSALPGATRDDLLIHTANSAGALAHPKSRRSFVRAGIAIYGVSPGAGVDEHAADLRPAMTVRTMVSHVKRVPVGSRVSYGLRHEFTSDTTVATIPVGYADGVPRRLFEVGGEVLIGGRRLPIVGAVTMDQLMVDAGDDDVHVGDEVVLIGEQSGPDGTDRIRAEEWADRLGTIGYEIVCGISRRMPRVPRRSIER
jgi:alanine racemase